MHPFLPLSPAPIAAAPVSVFAVDPRSAPDERWRAWLPSHCAAATQERQWQSAAGRYCAAEALASAGAAGPGVLPRDARGAPVWPAGFVGSISHADSSTGAIAAAVAAPAAARRGLGFDIEAVEARPRPEAILRRILAPGEHDVFHAVTAVEEAARLALFFSAKESLYKALSPIVGRVFWFSAAALVEVDVPAGRFSVELREALGGELRPGWRGGGRFALTGPWVQTIFELDA